MINDDILVRPFVSRVKQNRLKHEDFETIQIIGRGAFGQGKFSFVIDIEEEKSNEEILSLIFRFFSDIGQNQRDRTNICDENFEQIETFRTIRECMFSRRISSVDVR